MARFLALIALAASALPAAAQGLSPRERGDLAIRARGILKKHCGECHTGETAPGKSRLLILDHPALVSKDAPVPFVAAGDAGRSQILQLIEDGSMPPGGRPRPTEEEIAVLRRWVAEAKAPAFPRAFDNRYVLETMLADWERQKPEDQKFIRYVSFAHLATEDGSAPKVADSLDRVNRGMLHGLGRKGVMTGMMLGDKLPADEAAVVYRIDLRAWGWAAADLFDRVTPTRAGPDAYPLIPFDLVLSEYPHGFALPPTDPLTSRLGPFFAATKQVRPVPFLAGDWLADALSHEKERPTQLADELRSLGELAGTETDGKPPPDGPRRSRFAGKWSNGGHVWSAEKTATFAAIPPLGAWSLGDVCTNPPPFKLKLEAIDTGGKTIDTVRVKEPFNLRVTSDRDVGFTLLSVLPDGSIQARRTKGGNQITRGTPLMLEPPNGGPFKVGSRLTDEDWETENFVLLAAEGEAPPVTLVRSRHAQRPIWRFLPGVGPDGKPVEGFDPRKVVRVVMPLKIVAEKP